MKKFFTLILIGLGTYWFYHWYVLGINLLIQGDELVASEPYAFAVRITTKDKHMPGWETAAPMPTPRTDVAAAELGGKIYVVGGVDGLVKTVATVEAFDYVKNQWSTVAPLPKPVHAPAVVSDGSRLYVFGGLTGIANTPVDLMWTFDPATGNWTAGPELPEPVGAAAVAVVGGKAHLLGGLGLGSSVQDHYAFDFQSGEWGSLEPLISGRDHFAAAAHGSRLYAVGGRAGALIYNLSDLDSYDPAGRSWEPREPLSVKRSGHGAAVIDGSLYVFGGESATAVFADLYEYDPKTDKWRIGVPMPTARHGFGYATVQGRIYTFGGGRRSGYSISDIVEVFTP